MKQPPVFNIFDQILDRALDSAGTFLSLKDQSQFRKQSLFLAGGLTRQYCVLRRETTGCYNYLSMSRGTAKQ